MRHVVRVAVECFKRPLAHPGRVSEGATRLTRYMYLSTRMAIGCCTIGSLKALLYLVETYSIFRTNHASQAPVLRACRSGQLDCALYLLDRGASLDGDSYVRGTPLYWLCAFSEKGIAARLVRSWEQLASTPLNRGIRRPNFRFWVDSENLFCLPASPPF
ncbi:hypothetical protein E1B28_013681 [Marasmius oreades]|uniref:Uncharacterized protein n=1 Tax=Marasmius oreades TaxID=181124 RepID=A0A9P7UMH4_9AGAR|nr:uncharacterized protein E1B28_013681 [Marasmius oreades]KAG7087737.1 hypothetical protein E1B28_013681 [Marasmius oreades]